MHVSPVLVNRRSPKRLLGACAIALSLVGLAAQRGTAQTSAAVAASTRVHRAVDSREPGVLLRGLQPEWATAENDRGALPAGRRLDNLHLILARAPEVEAAFQQLLRDQQDPASPRFQQWLTPQQNAERYGIAPADLAAVTGWLQSQGLQVDDVAAGGVFVTFSGTAGAVQQAFATELHSFAHAETTRFAPVTDPAIPSSLAGVIHSVGGLAEMYFRPSLAPLGATPMDAVYPDLAPAGAGGLLHPNYNLSSGTYHFLSPGDFNLIYNVNPVLSSGTTGSGSRVAVIGGSRVGAGDISGYEGLYSLPAQQPTTVLLPGSTDPGQTGDGTEAEAVLDVSRVIATAPGAGPDLLIANNALQFSVTFSLLQYNISTLNDPIQSLSFGLCEYSPAEQSYAAQFDSYFSTAAAQGIGTYVSSGDSGAAGCDSNSGPIPATQVLAPNLLCSSPYATCVGGTEFADFASPSTYWAATNSSTRVSALGYIPEGAWNEPTVTSKGVTVYQATGSGGGVSPSLAKPTWQAGTGVPADGFRDTPDISFAGSTHNAYVLCFAAGGADCVTYVYPVGGTSASAPSMAAVAALLNQKLGKRQGNLNPKLYALAATAGTGAFHDVTPASSGVSACSTATPSMCNNSTPAASGLTGGLAGYPVTTGFDLATGLGSLDVNAFLNAIGTPSVSTALAVTVSPNPAATGSAVQLKASLTAGASTATPGGTVQFYANGAALGGAVAVSGNAATLSQSFSTAGTYAITAIYSGDGTFATSTSAAVSLQITAPGGVALASSPASLALVSGAATGNTSTVTVSAAGGFTGPVTLQCAVSGASGTVAGTASCGITPAAVTIGASGTATATLTVTSTPGTAGSLNAVVTASSTGISNALLTVPVTVAMATITSAANPATLNIVGGATTGNTAVVTVTSKNGFAGPVTLNCGISSKTQTAAGTCSVTPSTLTLAAGGSATATFSVASTAGTYGLLRALITVDGLQAGATIPAQAPLYIDVNLAIPGITLTAAPTSLSLKAGDSTGNASALTLSSVSGFSGAVNLACSVAYTGGTATVPAQCTVAPASVSLTANGTAGATLSIGTTAQVGGCTASLEPRAPFGIPGGVMVAGLLFLLTPLRRRRLPRLLSMAVLLLGGLAAVSGCGGGGTPSTGTVCPAIITPGTTKGTYTVTITATSAASSAIAASATVSVTVN